MRLSQLGAGLAVLSATLCAAETNTSQILRQVLPDYEPPNVFKNINLVRTINLEKIYVREQVNVVIENTSKEPQSEYWLPFEAAVAGKIGGLVVKDKKVADGPAFVTEQVATAATSLQSTPASLYLIQLPQPLKPSEQQTLSISYSILSAFAPLPARIVQTDKQYLTYDFNAYWPSSYATLKQKTKVKFLNPDVTDVTTIKSKLSENSEDPVRQGQTFTYGPFSELPASASSPVSVRFEFTRPVIHATSLERDIEVSHWGGNLATEERYVLENKGAQLSKQFSRTAYATTNYYNPPTSALKEMKIPLAVGSVDAYFIDDIGNVSTSRFRSNKREALLELKPRYPIFGGWHYKFKVGWDQDLKRSLRKLSTGDTYALKVPFLEGPKQPEGTEYGHVQLRVILPEGATNVKFETSIPLIANETFIHRTFMDTIGRTGLKLTAVNLVDDDREKDLHITYEYSYFAGFRKPLTIVVAVFTVFTAAFVIGRIDFSIASKPKSTPR